MAQLAQDLNQDQFQSEAVRQEEIAYTYAKARQNLLNFRKILLEVGPDETDPAPFHYDWSESLLNGSGHEAIEGFRESAKTQYVLRSFPLYALTFPSKARDYIVIIKNNSTLAANKLKEIEREYTSNPLLSFNLSKVITQSGEAFHATVLNEDGDPIDVLIEAYGKGASIRGLANRDRRPKIVIIDDPQDLEDARSPSITENDWEWFLGDVMFLGKNTRIFLIGNNLGEACIIERVFNNYKQLNFSTRKIPILVGDESAWPSMFQPEFILEEKENYRKMGKLDVWMRERMCEAASEETRVFHRNDYRYFASVTIPKFLHETNVFFTIDPASSQARTSCYRAIVINAVNESNWWFIVDVPFGRWDSTELIDVLFDKVLEWRPNSVGIERGMYEQIIKPFIYTEMARRNVFFDIREIEHAKEGSKLERVKMLGPRFKAHTIWFPQEAPWLTEMESELAGVTRDGFKSLYVDLIDALAMQNQIAMPPVSLRARRDLPREAEL